MNWLAENWLWGITILRCFFFLAHLYIIYLSIISHSYVILFYA